MPERALVDRLDDAVQAVLTGSSAAVERELAPFVALARELRDLPRPSFRARLRADLLKAADTRHQERLEPVTPATTEPRTPVRHTASPRLRVKNAAAAIDFYIRAFGAREVMRFEAGGSVPHAEIEIGNALIMLGDAAPEHGFPDPTALGGSPMGMHLNVDDADAATARAVAAGARLVRPVSNQFYGDRVGTVEDPFGYQWSLAARVEDMSVEEMQRRMAEMMAGQGKRETPSHIPAGFRMVTPYLVVENAPALIDFTKRVFGAEELFRGIGSAGGVHAHVQIGDSIVMVGGGGPGLSWRGTPMPTALHVYVEDVDAAYERAIDAGATSIGEPIDQPYGERGGGVKDPTGNVWYIATAKGASHIPAGAHSVQVYLHPRRAEPLIAFLEKALGAKNVQKYAEPDGLVRHASVPVGDSLIEMGEAEGRYQPMPTMFYVYVPDAAAQYWKALQAGATGVSEPKDQEYGDRTAVVKDAFGNTWYFATHLRDMA